MKVRLAGLVLAVPTCVGIVCAGGCDQKGIEGASRAKADAAKGKEPLLLEEEPLLLADDPASKEHDGKGADNSRCYVCHINYVREDLAARHARANVGCARCHGQSDAHIADESWASGGKGTPPEIMYPRAKINALCLGCHPSDKIDAKQHKEVLAGAGTKKYCTDCHGKHRLPERRCKWR